MEGVRPSFPGASATNNNHECRVTNAIDTNKPQITTEEALDDVHTRFILNLPPQEFESSDRIFFQLEQAFWFYDDFYCDSNMNEDGTTSILQRFSSLKPFARTMFTTISPLLQPMSSKFDAMWDEFTKYKRKISTYGTILMNEACTNVVLCQSYSSSSWTFPAGKVNYGETGVEAASRETYEETGFDPNCQLGLTRQMKEDKEKDIFGDDKNSNDEAENKKLHLSIEMGWSPLDEEDALTYVEDGIGKRRTCYVCRGVPQDFPFSPVCRKEVGEVQWHPLTNLPKKSYAVSPFLGQLKRWIRKRNRWHQQGEEQGESRRKNSTPKRDRSNKRGKAQGPIAERDSGTIDSAGGETPQRGKPKRRGSSGSGGSYRNRARSDSGGMRSDSRGRVRDGDAIALSGLASVGDEAGWSEADMFRTNETLLGRKVEYDGNPHNFDTDLKMDPHRFHVVGGTFLNSRNNAGISSLAPPPETSRLQPLFNSRLQNVEGNKDAGLQPFFSSQGTTPWGDVISDAAREEVSAARDMIKVQNKIDSGRAATSGTQLREDLKKILSVTENDTRKDVPTDSVLSEKCEIETNTDSKNVSDLFLTDREVTDRSQRNKQGRRSNPDRTVIEMIDEIATNKRDKKPIETDATEVESDFDYLKKWAHSLDRVPPSDMFGPFKFDVDAIMNAMRVHIA